eukprot:TRINITY_DN16004_c0_g1_i1.p1 TRINITY_DN16004_c0_g1~~TRINITY_DN16004_c0_g1_i1.p1  ORF type:complete len:887 (+),score=205.18 TRINITY_DN16004_c0_g1_i1:299-2959(+)
MGSETTDSATAELFNELDSVTQDDDTPDSVLMNTVSLLYGVVAGVNSNGLVQEGSAAERYQLSCVECLTYLIQNANISAATLNNLSTCISSLFSSAPHLIDLLVDLTGFVQQLCKGSEHKPLSDSYSLFTTTLQGLTSGSMPPAKRQRLDQPRFDLNFPDNRLVTRSELNAIITESFKELDASSEPIPTLHLKGLEENIVQEARKLQWAELQVILEEKSKRQVVDVETKGEIDVVQLLKHVETSDYALRKGREELLGLKMAKDTRTQQIVQDAFQCITETCVALPSEGQAAFKQGAALLSRLVVQEGSDETRANVIQSCMAGDDFNIGFALQLLYSHYAALAPFEQMGDPDLIRADLEPLAPSPDCELKFIEPLHWVKTHAHPATPFAFDDANKGGKLNKYTDFFLQLFDHLKDRVMLELSPKATILSELLVNCPALPKEIWEFVNNVFCMSGDKLKTWTGLRTITQLLKRRPAAKQRALSYLLQYCIGECEVARTGAINFLLYDVLPEEAGSEETALQFVKSVITSILDMKQDSKEGVIEAKLKNCMPLFFTLCVGREHLLSHLFDVIIKCKEQPRQQRAILGHPDLEKLVAKLGPTKLLGAINTLPLCNLSLHIMRLLIHQAKEELANETVPVLKEQIEKELLGIEQVAISIYQRENDMRFMILLLSLTPREAIKQKILPDVLTKCREEHVCIALKEAITPLTHHYHKGLGMSPVDMLMYLHSLVPSVDGSGPTLKNIVVAIDKCLINLRHIFTEQEVATVLQQLVTVDPPPQVLMRTILQTVYSQPNLLSFILSTIMPVLFGKKIWELEDQILWKGFVKLANDHQPKTLDTLLLLPEKVLLDMLSGNTQLLRHFVRYLNQNKLVHSKLLSMLESTFAGISHIA